MGVKVLLFNETNFQSLTVLNLKWDGQSFVIYILKSMNKAEQSELSNKRKESKIEPKEIKLQGKKKGMARVFE